MTSDNFPSYIYENKAKFLQNSTLKQKGNKPAHCCENNKKLIIFFVAKTRSCISRYNDMINISHVKTIFYEKIIFLILTNILINDMLHKKYK